MRLRISKKSYVKVHREGDREKGWDPIHGENLMYKE